MQRIRVDLPELDGPHTTIFSPRFILRLICLSLELSEALVNIDQFNHRQGTGIVEVHI